MKIIRQIWLYRALMIGEKTLKYSKQPGYSGEIVKVLVNIYEDGSCELNGVSNVFVHRLWMMEDWISLMEDENMEITNCNYPTETINLINVISYTRRSARGYAYASKIWVLHNEEEPVEYSEVLSAEEKEEIKKISRFYCKSYKKIKYHSSPRHVDICNKAIAQLSDLKMYSSKAWYRETKKRLIEIRNQ